MIAPKLNPGDEIRVIAPSRSLSIIRPDIFEHALAAWQVHGFKVMFSKNCRELTEFSSSSIHALFDCLMKEAPFCITPSNAVGEYHVIQEGSCGGEIIGGNLCTLNLLQGTPYMPELPFPEQYLDITMEKFKKAGFEIVDGQEAFRPIKFWDVGALVWFARIIEWEFPGFTVEGCLENLFKVQEMLEKEGVIEGRIHRFLVVAKKV